MEHEECKYIKSFDSFCDFVKEQLVDCHNIFYMSKLKEEFVRTVKNIESEDATNYRTWRLKERLCERFPQLVFHTPKVRNNSEIVYVEDLSCETVAENMLTMTEQRAVEGKHSLIS